MKVLFCLSLLNLTQPCNFLNAPLGRTVIYGLDLPTSSIITGMTEPRRASSRRGEPRLWYINSYQDYTMILVLVLFFYAVVDCYPYDTSMHSTRYLVLVCITARVFFLFVL